MPYRFPLRPWFGLRLSLGFLLPEILLTATACRNHPETSFVDDRGGLLKTEQLIHLNNYHHLLLRNLNIHFQLTILAESPDDPDRKAVELFDTLGLGETTGGARGVLLLVDPVGEQVRLEIGYDLEGTFPDGFVAYLEREQMAPFFAAGRVGDGVEATVELLVGRSLGEVPADFQGGKVELKHLSGGAGARSPMPIGDGIQTKPVVENEEDFAAQPSPRQTLERYLEILQQHVKDPDLCIYTPESRNFFRKWLVTDAQQDHERKELEKNLPQAVKSEFPAIWPCCAFPAIIAGPPPICSAALSKAGNSTSSP